MPTTIGTIPIKTNKAFFQVTQCNEEKRQGNTILKYGVIKTKHDTMTAVG